MQSHKQTITQNRQSHKQTITQTDKQTFFLSKWVTRWKHKLDENLATSIAILQQDGLRSVSRTVQRIFFIEIFKRIYVSDER